jgi:hypothetical protein
MTRKDYELIADAIAETPTTDSVTVGFSDKIEFETLIANLCERLAADNPRFDSERFEQACRR